MTDVVINSLGSDTWKDSFSSIGVNNRCISFITLTGSNVELNIPELYSKQIKLIGSSKGNIEKN
jgi:NADPH:quinone reductase-like Zn-dependent oxidoreductase